jgi:hypothetical protein
MEFVLYPAAAGVGWNQGEASWIEGRFGDDAANKRQQGGCCLVI